MPRTIDVIVVTYNSAPVIETLLDSVPAALGGMAARVAVVDNCSQDHTRDLLKRRSDVDLVEADNRGYGAGLNRGVAHLDGDGPILLCNPDVTLGPGCIAELVRTLRPGVGIVVPTLVNGDGNIARSLRREPSVARSLGAGDSNVPWLSEIVNDPSAYTRLGSVDWATGAVMLVDRECFTRLRGFDESFFMYSEETDFCLRARDLGLATVFTPHAVATHIGAQSGTSPELYSIQVLNRVRLHRRRHNLVSSALLLLLTLLREGVWSLRGNRESRRAFAALTCGSSRPRQLPWSGSLLTRSRAEASL